MRMVSYPDINDYNEEVNQIQQQQQLQNDLFDEEEDDENGDSSFEPSSYNSEDWERDHVLGSEYEDDLDINLDEE